MSLQLAAHHLASKGRGEDKMLVHMTPREVHGLQALAMAHGGSLTINPDTGLPEAGFLSSILPMIAGLALAPLTAGTSLAFLGASPFAAAMTVGGITGLATGSLQKGLMAGLGAYGGAGLGEALTAAGGVGAGAAGAALAPDAAAQAMSRSVAEATGQEVAKAAAQPALVEGAMSPMEKMYAGIKGLAAPESAARDAFMQKIGGLKGVAQYGLAAAAPIMADQAVQAQLPKTTTSSPTAYITPYSFNPYTGGLASLGRWKPEEFPGFAGPTFKAASGGAVALADGGVPDPTQMGNPTAAQLAAQQSIVADPVTAARNAALSGIQKGLNDQQIADMVNAQYGKTFSAQNVADFMKTQGIERPTFQPAEEPGYVPPTPTITPSSPVATTAQPAVPVIPSTPVAPDVADAAFNPATAAPTAAEVVKQYTQGGGRVGPPDISTVLPTERLYTQNRVYQALQDWVQSHPNPLGAEIMAVSSQLGIPEAQVRAALNEYRFSSMAGASKSAYDYLMGRGPYSVNQMLPGGAPLMQPYLEASGIAKTSPAFQFVAPTKGATGTTPTTPTQQLTAPSGASLSEAERSALGNTFVQAQQSNNYSGVNSMIQNLKLTKEDLLKLFPSLTEKGVDEWVNSGKIKLYEPVYAAGGLTAFDDGGDVEETGIAQIPTKIKPRVNPVSSMHDDDLQQAYDLSVKQQNIPQQRKLKAEMELRDRLRGVQMYSFGGMPKIEQLGILGAAAAGGHVDGHLGGYSDGGRLLRGPGDGVSDSIPATIGEKQPARLADGEFVVPARIVSEIGNGSTEAGARKLYAMMDRVQRARKKTTGKDRVAADTKADQYLPA